MDPVVKPRGDTVGFTSLRNNALRKNNTLIL
ncbi:MAG TPA: hypothetical protein LFV92_06975 [Rickettsia endosymbiont of Ceroptres masudai]|nr:hypothetical protein [Rickettsia endosymbiont of Ceroptres masudai]